MKQRTRNHARRQRSAPQTLFGALRPRRHAANAGVFRLFRYARAKRFRRDPLFFAGVSLGRLQRSGAANCLFRVYRNAGNGRTSGAVDLHCARRAEIRRRAHPPRFFGCTALFGASPGNDRRYCRNGKLRLCLLHAHGRFLYSFGAFARKTHHGALFGCGSPAAGRGARAGIFGSCGCRNSP